MPPWRENLNNEQLAVVLTYIRTQLGGNHATPLTPEFIAALRKEPPSAPENAEQLLRIADQ
jgi:mono/diheme cytochrome c family protein